MYYKGAGNVGIGTSSPQYTLDIYRSDTNPAVRIYGTSNKQLTLGGDSLGGFVGTATDDDLRFITNNGVSVPVTIKTSGKVGIGTDSPAFKLDVEGDAAFKYSIGTSSFASGFAGYGWRIDSGSTGWGLTLDDLTVRGTMNVYELLVHQTRATNGSLWVSSTGKVDSVTALTAPSFSLQFDTGSNTYGHGFLEGDLIRAQRYQGNESFQSNEEFQSKGK